LKKLQLTTTVYNRLEDGFSQWLDVLGYNKMTIYNMPNIARGFLYFLEQKHIYSIKEVQPKHIKDYHKYIQSRVNERRGGGLSNNYINKHVQALEKFVEYLSHRGMDNVPTVNIKLLPLFTRDITILTVEEVKELYKATDLVRKGNHLRALALVARDKCILSIFYGCGLRRNEGVNLKIGDIDFDRRVLIVKKGKNYKQRIVPFGKQTSKTLEDYVFNHRPYLVKQKNETTFFVGYRGELNNGITLYKRLKLIQLAVDNPILQSKTIGLHSLRHSIATHFLQSGMELQKIQKFLGHSSLESTQIYTHLIEKD
jgi:integrase/recombinase XerD